MAELLGFVKVTCDILAFQSCGSGIASSHCWESSRDFSPSPNYKWFSRGLALHSDARSHLPNRAEVNATLVPIKKCIQRVN